MEQGNALNFLAVRKPKRVAQCGTKRIAPEGYEQEDKNLDVQVIKPGFRMIVRIVAIAPVVSNNVYMKTLSGQPQTTRTIGATDCWIELSYIQTIGKIVYILKRS